MFDIVFICQWNCFTAQSMRCSTNIFYASSAVVTSSYSPTECEAAAGAGGGWCGWGRIQNSCQDPKAGQTEVSLVHTLYTLPVQRQNSRYDVITLYNYVVWAF